MYKIKKYFKGVGIESRRVRWPHKKELWSSVGIVCVVTIITALILVCSDLLAVYLIDGFENAFPSSSGSDGSNSIVSEIRLFITLFGGLIK